MTDGVAVTPSTAATRQTIDTDEVVRGGQTVQQQVVKLSLGADGASDTLVDSGPQSSANSVPVVIASDQSAVPVSISIAVPVTDNGGSLTVDGSVTVSGTVTANAGSGPFPVSDNAGSLTVDDGGGSLTVDGSVSISGTVSVDTELPAAAALADATANPTTPLAGAANLLFNGSSWDRLRGDTTNGVDVDVTRLPSGTIAAGSTGTAGSASANVVSIQGVASMTSVQTDLRQINGTAITQNVGTAGNGTQRVAIATDGQGQVADNTAFTDGTTRLDMAGYIFDETAGTALTENDAAAARIDSKRAQVLVIEDATTRGQRMAVKAASTAAAASDPSAVVALSPNSPLPAGTNVIGALSANQSVNLNQVAGAAVAAGHGTAAGSLRVELPTDGTGVVGLNAGSNVIGKVGIDQTTPGTTNALQGIPGTSGGLSASKTISAASTNATSVKGSAGQVYSIYAHNLNAAVRYLKLYNKASAPTVGTDTPLLTLPIPGNTAGAGFVLDTGGMGIAFSTGIAFALTTGVADADTGAVAANDIVANILYK